MDGKIVLLLFMVLFPIVKCQSTTSLPFNENQDLKNFEDHKDASNDDMQASESTIRFLAIDPEDRKKEQPDNGITSSSDDDDDSGELELLKTLLDPEFFSDASNENNTTQLGKTANIKGESSESEEPLVASNTDKVESRSQGPELNQPNEGFVVSKEEKDNSRSLSPFEQERKQIFRSEPSSENSPLMQLTQGGYRRPFQVVDNFRDQRQSLRSESVPLQAEVMRNPNNNQNPSRNRLRQQQPYNSIFQPPNVLQPGPVFRHPFSQQPINFANANGRIPSSIQNSFYNTQPDFSQSQYPQLDSPNDFSTINFALQPDQRNSFPNSEYMFQAPFQIPVSQSVPAHMPGQMPAVFQSAASPSYSNNGSPMFPNGADFQTLFGNVPQSNPQFQENHNLYSGNPNLGGSIFANPAFGLLPNFPASRQRSQFLPTFVNSQNPQQPTQISIQNGDPSAEIPTSSQAENQEKSAELLTETPNKEDPVSVPFGARIQRPNEDQNEFERQDNMYIRYPLEAGYATEEALPPKNETEKETKSNEVPLREPFPFFSIPRSYNIFEAPDPYRAALANVQRGYPIARDENNENKNETEGKNPEGLAPELSIMPNSARPQTPRHIFRNYPERTPDLSIPEASFYPIQGVGPNRNPFEPIQIFPDNRFQFAPRPIAQPNEESQTPVCAKATNDSICFEDPEYPKGEILYSLNADSFLTERMIMPDQELQKITLVDQNETESNESEDNYICKSDIKYGLPLRAQTAKGKWKVIVNMERPAGRGNYIQPVRLEICRGLGDPCTSVTEIKTECVQKYSLQRLLSWTADKGVHNDVYKIPIACSCQILQSKP